MTQPPSIGNSHLKSFGHCRELVTKVRVGTQTELSINSCCATISHVIFFLPLNAKTGFGTWFKTHTFWKTCELWADCECFLTLWSTQRPSPTLLWNLPFLSFPSGGWCCSHIHKTEPGHKTNTEMKKREHVHGNGSLNSSVNENRQIETKEKLKVIP